MRNGEATSLAARLRALNERTRDSYEGSDIELARRFAFIMWPAGILVVSVLLPFFQPTQAVGTWGWLIPIASTTIVGGGVAYAWRNRERVTYDFLYFASYVSLISLAATQWAAGGRIAPYHEIFLLQVIGSGLMHPPRRFARFLVAVIAASYAPLLYAPSTVLLGEVATEMCLWGGIGAFLVVFLRRIRDQRVALRQAGEEAHELARADALTGLGNRRAFDEHLAKPRPAGTRTSLLVMDLNGFKQINDTHGHVAGDECLRQTAEALRSAVRDGDPCFRWGGDEFAVVLSGASASTAAQLAARVEAIVAEQCQGPDGEPLTLACGHAEITAAATPADAVAAADQVLLELKCAPRAATPAR